MNLLTRNRMPLERRQRGPVVPRAAGEVNSRSVGILGLQGLFPFRHRSRFRDLYDSFRCFFRSRPLPRILGFHWTMPTCGENSEEGAAVCRLQFKVALMDTKLE